MVCSAGAGSTEAGGVFGWCWGPLPSFSPSHLPFLVPKKDVCVVFVSVFACAYSACIVRWSASVLLSAFFLSPLFLFFLSA